MLSAAYVGNKTVAVREVETTRPSPGQVQI